MKDPKEDEFVQHEVGGIFLEGHYISAGMAGSNGKKDSRPNTSDIAI